jgi:NAD(P)H-flavin reductase
VRVRPICTYRTRDYCKPFPALTISRCINPVREANDSRPLKLVYGNRLVEQIMYQGELDAMEGSLDIEIHHVISEPPPDWPGAVGQLDKAVLQQYLDFDDLAHWLYVVCGPGPMIDSIEGSLKALGVPHGQILSEKFSYG